MGLNKGRVQKTRIIIFLEYAHYLINFVYYIPFIIMSKIIRKFENEDTIAIWTYDLEKFKNGPISVEIIDKKPEPRKKKPHS